MVGSFESLPMNWEAFAEATRRGERGGEREGKGGEG